MQRPIIRELHQVHSLGMLSYGNRRKCFVLVSSMLMDHAQEDEPTAQQAARIISLLANSLPISLTASVHVFWLCLQVVH